VLEAARRAAALSHPFVAMLFDVVSEEGTDALAFEFVDGTALGTRVDGRSPDIRRALDVTGAVAQALACAHDLGIAHLDVRPANILFSTRGRPKLIETGFSAFTRGGAMRRALVKDPDNASAEAQDAAAYVSPEEALGDEATVASDVFSLGVVFYELLTGRRPFEAVCPADVLVRAARSGPVAPRVRNAAIPPALDALVLGCLDRSPRSRLSAQTVAPRTAAVLASLQDV
jgi:serine/threonine-protein kinase